METYDSETRACEHKQGLSRCAICDDEDEEMEMSKDEKIKDKMIKALVSDMCEWESDALLEWAQDARRFLLLQLPEEILLEEFVKLEVEK